MARRHTPSALTFSRTREDNPNNQQVARELLEDEGARVQVANNGREGVEAVAAADALLDRRVALIYTSPLGRAVETGMIVAEALGVPVRQQDGLQEFRVADLAGARFDDDRLTTTYAA